MGRWRGSRGPVGRICWWTVASSMSTGYMLAVFRRFDAEAAGAVRLRVEIDQQDAAAAER